MCVSGVCAQQFARQTIAYLAGSVGAAIPSMKNVVKPPVKCLAYGKRTGCGWFAVNVGAAGNQWTTPAITKRNGYRVTANPDGERVMPAAQPIRYFRRAGKYPGDGGLACLCDALSGCRAQWQQQRLQLLKMTGYKYQTLINIALLQANKVQRGMAIERITSQAVHRFCRISDNATGIELTDGFPDMPAHDAVLLNPYHCGH